MDDIIETVSCSRPAEGALGERTPKPTALTEGLLESERPLWADARRGLDVGYWECTTGRFTAVRDGYTEICQLLTGRVRIEVEGRPAVELAAGDTLVMPSGWRGTWDVREPLRKLYVIVDDAAPGSQR